MFYVAIIIILCSIFKNDQILILFSIFSQSRYRRHAAMIIYLSLAVFTFKIHSIDILSTCIVYYIINLYHNSELEHNLHTIICISSMFILCLGYWDNLHVQDPLILDSLCENQINILNAIYPALSLYNNLTYKISFTIIFIRLFNYLTKSEFNSIADLPNKLPKSIWLMLTISIIILFISLLLNVRILIIYSVVIMFLFIQNIIVQGEIYLITLRRALFLSQMYMGLWRFFIYDKVKIIHHYTFALNIVICACYELFFN